MANTFGRFKKKKISLPYSIRPTSELTPTGMFILKKKKKKTPTGMFGFYVKGSKRIFE